MKKNIVYVFILLSLQMFGGGETYALEESKLVKNSSEPASFFSREELEWIKAHPRQEVAFTGGEKKLYNIDYFIINKIQEMSGLVFSLKILPSSYKEAIKSNYDVVVGINDDYAKKSLINDRYYFSKPFINLELVVVTKSNHPYISTIDELKNVRVSAQKNTLFYFENKNILSLIPALDSREIFNKVKTGEVDAGIVLDIHAKLLLRDLNHDLKISNPLKIAPLGMSILVSKKKPILFSIIKKSLAHITSGDLYEHQLQWRDSTKQTTPTLRELWVGYNRQIILTIFLVVFQFIFILLSFFAYRAKKNSELSKSQFLSMMSHELRTPLGIVIASTELLQNTPLNKKQQELIQQTDLAARSLLVLLNDVLDISRINAGKLALDYSSVDLKRLLTRLYEQYQPIIRSKNLEFNLEIKNLPAYFLLLDEIRIQQVLHNLLSNAVKFTTQGHILLRADYQQNSKQLCLDVVDTGIGIAVKQQKKLFHPFVQASTSTAREYGGSGLGLSICKELVTLMGGTIQLKSSLGGGTKISVKLPVHLSEQLISSSTLCTTLVPSDKESFKNTILLVEDHPANQKIIQEQLYTLGFRCQLANDGYQALALLEEGKQFALILLDCHLPGMNGYQVAEQIRQQFSQKSLPIIAISATTGNEHYNRCITSGMDGVLNKPLKLAQLQSMLGLWIDDDLSLTPIRGEEPLDQQALFTLFINSSEEDFAKAQQALAQQDYPSALFYIHRICGAARTVAADDIAVIGERLEKMLGTNNISEVSNDMQKLRIALDYLG